MWMILKAELAYTRNGLLIGFAIAACFLLGAMLYSAWSGIGLMINTSIVFFISVGVLGSEAEKEKRTRILASLPVRPQEIGFVEQYYILFFYLSMVFLWLVHAVVDTQLLTSETFSAIFSIAGLVLALINAFVIHSHLGYWGGKRYKLLTVGTVFLLLLAVFLLAWQNSFQVVWRSASALFFSPAGSTICMVLYFLMASLAIAAFVKRKSYLA